MERLNRYLYMCRIMADKKSMKHLKGIYIYTLISNNNTKEFTEIVQTITGNIFNTSSELDDYILYSFGFYEALIHRNKTICDVLYDQINRQHNVAGGVDWDLALSIRIDDYDDAEALKYMIEIYPNTFQKIYRDILSNKVPKLYEFLFNTYIKDEDYVIQNDPNWRDRIFYSFLLFNDESRRNFHFEMSILDDFISIGYPKTLSNDAYVGEANQDPEDIIEPTWSIDEMLYGLLIKANRQMFHMHMGMPLVTWRDISEWFDNDDYVAMVRYIYSQIYFHFAKIHINVFDGIMPELHNLLRTSTLKLDTRMG